MCGFDQSSSRSCCGAMAAPPGLFQRGVEVIRWIAPGVLMAVMPKCPMCLAAHVAFWTGIGLSATSASYVRLALVVLCPAYLAFLIVTRLRRWARRGATHQQGGLS